MGDRDRRTGRAVAKVSALGMLERILKRGGGGGGGCTLDYTLFNFELIAGDNKTDHYMGFDCTRVCSREF